MYPNIILVITDDQRADSLRYMPGVQRIAQRGVTFQNAYATTPICSSSRASILTGNTANVTGVKTNLAPNGGALVMDHEYTIARIVKLGRGYRTGYFGKYQNEYHKMLPPYVEEPFTPPWWDDFRAFAYNATDFWNYSMNENGAIVPYVNQYSTDVIREQALAFIAAQVEPYFMVFAPAGPHLPASPAPQHVGSYADWGPFRPASYKEADISEKPQYIQDAKANWTDEAAADLDAFVRAQIETLQSIDEAVVALHQAAGPDTLFIFTSDNGLMLGEHWMQRQKRTPYEEAMRVPLIVTGPGVTPHDEPRLALNIDLAPTIGHYTSTLPFGEGRSLHKLLAGALAPGWRRDFLAQAWNMESVYNPDSFEAVVSRDWKYIKHIGLTQHVTEELYHLASDPFEMTDVKGVYPEKLAELRARLAQLLVPYQT